MLPAPISRIYETWRNLRRRGYRNDTCRSPGPLACWLLIRCRDLRAVAVALILAAGSLAIARWSAANTSPRHVWGRRGLQGAAAVRRHPDLQGVWGNNRVTPDDASAAVERQTGITDADLDEIKQLASQSVDQAVMRSSQLHPADSRRDRKGRLQADLVRVRRPVNYNQF